MAVPGTPGAIPASLLILSPSGQRTKVAISRFPFVIGRSPESQVVLRDNRVSRYHARITAGNGHYVIEDLASSHGTWVNGEKIASHILRNSDLISFGVDKSYQLTFKLESPAIDRVAERLQAPELRADTEANRLVKLRSVMEAARALQESLSTQEVLTAVVDAALTVTSCERGFLLLRKGDRLDIAVARDSTGTTLEAGELRVPTSVIQKALESRRELLSMSFDPSEQAGIRPEMTVAALELRSVVCLPLVHIRQSNLGETRVNSAAEATAGLLYLDSRTNAADLSSGNRELLQTLAIEASTILENARLMEQERLKQRMEDELKIARNIQQGLLPASLPSEGWFRAAGTSTPATQVGGDYFDVRRIEPGLWAAIVADVSGKGVSSALLASLLQGAFMMASGQVSDTPSMLARWNAYLLERTVGEKYATIFYCTLDTNGLLHYVNAGHCAPYVVSRQGEVRRLETTGTPVGMVDGVEFAVVNLSLQPGDKVVIYSDGLTEAENAEGVFFEKARLRAFLRDHASLDAIELHRLLIDLVQRFSEGGVIRDDVTVLVLEYHGSPSGY